MEKLWALIKRVVPALPYVMFLTVLLYLAGREYNTNYWRGMGLPLMATDRQFADMLYEGFLAYILWTGSLLGIQSHPELVVVAVAAAGVAIYAGIEFGVDRALARAAARRRKSPKPRRSRRATRTLGWVERQVERFLYVTLCLLAVTLAFGMTVLTPAVPSLALGSKGFDVAKADTTMYEARMRKLRDRLVDSIAVFVKRTDDGKPVPAIAIECRGDRCAAMTVDGPISLPKDRFGEESVVRADLTEACFTEEGLKRRRAEAAIKH